MGLRKHEKDFQQESAWLIGASSNFSEYCSDSIIDQVVTTDGTSSIAEVFAAWATHRATIAIPQFQTTIQEKLAKVCRDFEGDDEPDVID